MTELSPRKNPATLNYSVNHGTLRIKQLLGLAGPMANLDLAAPSTAILRKRRFSCPFAGLGPSCNPVAKIVQTGEPTLRFRRQIFEPTSHRISAARGGRWMRDPARLERGVLFADNSISFLGEDLIELDRYFPTRRRVPGVLLEMCV